MLSTVEFKNNNWTITHDESGARVTADQVVGDFAFLRPGVYRGRVLVSHGVPQEMISRVSQSILRHLGIGAPESSVTAKKVTPGYRRTRLLPGGTSEPYAM